MGDEDWEAEIKPHMSSYVPIFEKVITFEVELLNAMDFIKVENHCGESSKLCSLCQCLSPCDCY